MTEGDVGVIGLAVMGQNLALNLADHGFRVSAFNRDPARTAALIARAEPEHHVHGADSLGDFVTSLRRPRSIITLIRAGEAVDELLERLLPLLDPGDIVVDAGNSHYLDTARRVETVGARGVHFVGSGVSGGEAGARFGPAIMPGGDAAAWPRLEPLLTAIAAKAGLDEDEACCAWVGGGGAGHFVKMVHNAIEYGDMQVLAEVQLLLRASGRSTTEQADLFAAWNTGRLRSYLVEIVSEILRAEEEGVPLLDLIRDRAGQKGTGTWTAAAALELGQPANVLIEALLARLLSGEDTARSAMERGLGGAPIAPVEIGDTELEAALWSARLTAYAQGFSLMATASQAYGWDLDLVAIARIWRGGCIIRSDLLHDIAMAYDADPDLPSLLSADGLRAELTRSLPGLRRAVSVGATSGVATPGMSSALAYIDGLRSRPGSAALIQAMRDYFGAHTYERVDRPEGEWFHTDWIGSDPSAISGTYST